MVDIGNESQKNILKKITVLNFVKPGLYCNLVYSSIFVFLNTVKMGCIQRIVSNKSAQLKKLLHNMSHPNIYGFVSYTYRNVTLNYCSVCVQYTVVKLG